VERDRKAAAALKTNAERLAVITFGPAATEPGAADAHDLEPRARILQMAAERFLKRSHEAFDLILFDPPFADKGAMTGLAGLLDQHLAEGGYLYLETSRRSPLPLADRVVKSSTAGDCQFALYQ
jgi:16S rRNA G966 N2-methylase RsmD